MDMTKLYGEMADYYFENEDLSRLYEMKDDDTYKEIVLFLDDFKPEWRKNKELGNKAPEFILSIIDDFENNFDYDENYADEDIDEEDADGNEENEPILTFKEWLHKMYDHIADQYNFYSGDYDVEIDEVDQVLKGQGIEEEDEKYMEKWSAENKILLKEKGEEIYLFF
jgi:hypothetical protein